MENQNHNGPCPNCGYCPHCGRSNQPAITYPYAPYFPTYPTYPTYDPWIVWSGTATEVKITGNIAEDWYGTGEQK